MLLEVCVGNGFACFAVCLGADHYAFQDFFHCRFHGFLLLLVFTVKNFTVAYVETATALQVHPAGLSEAKGCCLIPETLMRDRGAYIIARYESGISTHFHQLLLVQVKGCSFLLRRTLSLPQPHDSRKAGFKGRLSQRRIGFSPLLSSL
jgi:hypothetical protein